MTPPQSKPLLTRDDLPLEAIAEICGGGCARDGG